MSFQGPTTVTTWLDRLLSCEDAAAWDEFVRLYAGPLFRLFRKFGAPPADAELLAQNLLGALAEYFLRLKKKGGRFDHSYKGAFRGFLYHCSKNAYLDYADKLRSRPKTGGLDAALDSGVRVVEGLPTEPVDHVEEAHFRWFLEETLQTAIRRALEDARARFPEKSYRAFEIVAVSATAGPDGTVYQIDTSPRADSALVTRAAEELGMTRDDVWDEKHKVRKWVFDRLKELLPEDV